MPLDADQIWRKEDILTGAELRAIYVVPFLCRFRCSSGLLQSTSPAKQSTANPPEQLLEDL